jgi:circadian clock protein KaiC
MEVQESNNSTTISRVTTGIAGFDDILFGGIPEGSQMVITGQPGTGKSLLAFHVVYSNARKGVPVSYVLVAQPKEALIKNVSSAYTNFKDIGSLMASNVLNITNVEANDKFTTLETVMQFIAHIIKTAQSNNSKVVVLDGLSLLRALLADDREFTRTMNHITESLDAIGATSLIIMELPDNNPESKIPGLLEESMFDGVIRLANLVNGDVTQHLCAIMKLRYSKYKPMPNTMEITPDGITMAPVK